MSMKQKDFLRTLFGREHSNKFTQRSHLKIFRTLACSDSYGYRKVWQKESRHPINPACDSAVFMNNYRTCYKQGGKDGNLVHKFTIPTSELPDKVEGCIFDNYKNLEKIDNTSLLNGPSIKMYAITKKDLVVIDMESGQVLLRTKMLQTTLANLSTIYWDSINTNFVISSTVYQSHTARPQGRREKPLVLKTIAMFNVLPLEFMCMFDVRRDVFGSDLVDVKIMENMLIAYNGSSRVRFFHLDKILRENKITPQLVSSGFQASYNLQIKELPVCLFEVRCDNLDVDIGGIPYHYVVHRRMFWDGFRVFSLKDGTQVKNNFGDPNNHFSLVDDRIRFYEGDSSRLVQFGKSAVRMLRLKEMDHGHELIEDFVLASPHKIVTPTVTSSGRIIRRSQRSTESEGQEFIEEDQDVEYEVELDVLLLYSSSDLDDGFIRNVGLYDNYTGRLLRNIQIEEHVFNAIDHGCTLHTDTIVQVVKCQSGKWICQVYRLVHRDDK